MKRGFKTKAEKRSLEIRKILGLNFNDPIDCHQVASYLKISVIKISELCCLGLSRNDLNIFSHIGEGYKEFSAVVLKTFHGYLMIYNHFHSPERINSSMAHEIAHVDCNHDFTSLGNNGRSSLIREFPKEVEDEANYFSGSLLIPREGLVWAAKNNMDINDIAQHFNTSVQMARWRYNITGVAAQMRHLSKYRKY